MAFPLLLQVGAVPFVTNSENSILARRSNGRSNQTRSHGITTSNASTNHQQSQTSSVILSRQQRAVIGQLMSEAAEAINDIIRQPTPETASICVNTDLSVPPNTPILTSTTFDFPESPSEVFPSNQQEGSVSTSEDESDLSPSPISRPVRKRRRPPSFKKQHRVVPKKNSSEADDEATSAEENSDLENLELKVKLGLLSHRDSENTSADYESEEEKDDSVEKWSKIGEELRTIADRFGAPPEMPSENSSDLVNPFQVTDLLSLVNLMLPVSVPQSLWSALLSYAAWKIFKKFQ